MAAAVEAGGFFLGTLGWGLLGVTLPNSYWRVSTVDGNVITTSTLFENLWQSCATDSTGVYNCRDFPSMLALSGYLQACRALMITALLFGFLAILCGVVGMKCTKVADGNPAVKGKMVAAGGCMFILAGLCGMVALSWYAFNITRDFFDPLFPGTKYEIGPALYLGWSGSLLAIVGGGCLLGSCCTHPSRDKSFSYPYSEPKAGPKRPRRGSDASSVGQYGKNAYV
ncbi:claudin-15 [Malaclemys terrapin pileata]|uniref:claudin-15 n=1 Tax=Malaclemys terrapin pileata TaxID=2991368 RepID=UPI0023A821F9|nr:claudin-15 [Malaclemys terrapin pileata]